MRDHDAAADDPRGSGLLLSVRGHLVATPRRIRTAEGWQTASLLLGPAAAGSAPNRTDVLVAVCAGAGAADALEGLAAGQEVVATGRPVPCRAADPADDWLELRVHALLALEETVGAEAIASDPRIGS